MAKNEIGKKVNWQKNKMTIEKNGKNAKGPFLNGQKVKGKN